MTALMLMTVSGICMEVEGAKKLSELLMVNTSMTKLNLESDELLEMRM